MMRRHTRPRTLNTGHSPEGSRSAQVLVEVALAAAGLVALALVTGRVGHWLNQSMVERNASYQATRAAAAQSRSVVRFDPPGEIHLIGPGPARTAGGRGPQSGGSVYDPTCSGGGQALLDQAFAKRLEALALLGPGQQFALPVQQDVARLHDEALFLVSMANGARDDARTVGRKLRDIEAIDRRLDEIHRMPIVQACGGINMLEECIADLNNQIADIDRQLAPINARLSQIDSDISAIDRRVRDIDSRVRAIDNRISTIMNVELPACTSLSCVFNLARELSSLTRERGDLLDERSALLSRRSGLVSERNQLLSERADRWNERQGLVNRRDALQRLLWEVVSRRSDKRRLLNDVDEITSRWDNAMRSLNQSLRNPSPHKTLEFWTAALRQLDLSNRYDSLLRQVDGTGLGEPSLLGLLRDIQDRLYEVGRDLNAEARHRYDHANSLIDGDLRNQSERIQELILEAEELERQGRAACASGPDA